MGEQFLWVSEIKWVLMEAYFRWVEVVEHFLWVGGGWGKQYFGCGVVGNFLWVSGGEFRYILSWWE